MILSKFKTKKAATEYIQNIISSSDLNVHYKSNSSQYNIFLDLLKNHPEKYNNQYIHSFIIKQHELFPKQKVLHFCESKDGINEISFSWIYCISQKKITKKQLFLGALRTSIHNQCLDFKILQKCNECWSCNICQDVIYDSNSAQVDHIVAFSTLADSFVKEYNVDVNIIQYQKNTTTLIDEFSSLHHKDLIDNWTLYHKKNAMFQILCMNCNLRKPKTKHDDSLYK
jgi:5-methylcytosine-specific restriction endonuclease McrA